MAPSVILPGLAGLAAGVNRFYDSCHSRLPCSPLVSALSGRCSRSSCRRSWPWNPASWSCSAAHQTNAL